ncbi:hypothetical protein DPMN_174685 [Dreissena polymorpha]|uniref:Uncharacterized protein n=1 Tax=Dreissena polymorpha TaxID=45954 RepID=A0A9D4E529_DREPO|nr:hypothetical protein DPMN_174685 [Dreissena polymorpha]
MDSYNGLREKDTGHENEMLLKTFGHLQKRPHYKRWSPNRSKERHRTPRRSADHCQKT